LSTNEPGKKEYYCSKHKSSDGFIDPDGKWICWLCYKEDLFYNPRGEIVMKKEIGRYILRAVSIQGHQLLLEKWKKTPNRYILSEELSYSYLSQLLNDWKRLVHHLERETRRT
jgi:hypothetical protein